MNGLLTKAWDKKLREESIAEDIFGFHPVYPHLNTMWEKFIWWFVWKIHAGQRRKAEEEWYSQEWTLMDGREASPMNIIIKEVLSEDFPTKLVGI